MNQPIVSVVMPVYNAQRYLREAIDSVLNQTFENFELIIVNDGSTDESLEIIKSYKDKRIRLISRKNKGVSASRNEAIRSSKAKYIAMHDADDVSTPDRLQKQFDYLASHPDVGLLGSSLEVIDPRGKYISNINLLTHSDDLKLAEIFSNQFGQGSVMCRRKNLIEAGLYDESMSFAEDADLWRRMLHLTKSVNLKERLYHYRFHGDSAMKHIEKIRAGERMSRDREFKYYLKNRSKYKLFSFHPFSMSGGLKLYLERKNSVYRNMSLLYAYQGLRRRAAPITAIAILHAPWIGRSYRQLWYCLTSRQKLLDLEYELF